MTVHWHVASGLTGYGPDGSMDTFPTGTTLVKVADLVTTALREWADSEHEQASLTAGENREDHARDYHAAWWQLKHGEELDFLALTFDPKSRGSAPKFKDDPAALNELYTRLIAEHFTNPVPVSEHSRLYVWECPEGDACEHLEDEED